jgi:four helix bundle protein
MESGGGFEKLVAWQQARGLTKAIYTVARKGDFARDFGLRDQIQRSAVSIMSNIAEGYERGSRNEFFQFLVIAKASCAEVRSQLYVALDVEYINQADFDDLFQQAKRLSKVISGRKSSAQDQKRRAKKDS